MTKRSNHITANKPVALWRYQASPLTTQTQRFWLERPGALTAGLRELGQLSLEVLREKVLLPSADERDALLHGFSNEPVWAREICMSIDGQARVVARTVTPVEASRSSWQRVRRLGGRPLADLLYDDPHVSRTPFETTSLPSRHPLAQIALARCLDSKLEKLHTDTRFWARRSVFTRHGLPLLVAECFLPTFWQMIDSRPRKTAIIAP